MNSLLRSKGNTALEPFAEGQPQKVLNADLDHSLRYFIIFIFLGGGAAAWLSYVLSAFQDSPGAVALLNVGIVGILFLVLTVFQAVLIQSTLFNVILILIEAAVLPTFLYDSFSGWLLIGGALFAAAWLLGYSRAKTFVNDAVKINFWHYSMMMLTGTITAIALFMACLYVGLYQRSGGISFNAYRFVVNGALPGFQMVVPNFNPETNVNTALEEYVRGLVEKQPGFSELPATQQRAVVKETTSGLRGKLAEFTKSSVKPGDTILGYTFQWLSDLIKNAEAHGLGGVVVASIFAVLFFGIKSVMFILKWPVLVVAFLLYLLLQSIGIVTIGAEMRQKEVIVVK